MQPVAEVGRRVREALAREHGAAGDVREIGCVGLLLVDAADGMAVSAGELGKARPPEHRVRRGGSAGGRRLSGNPRIVRFGRVDDGAETHPGVLRATELRTGAQVGSGPCSRDPNIVVTARNGVDFAAQFGYPEIVDYVGGVDLEQGITAG